jgi:hypothetical protein
VEFSLILDFAKMYRFQFVFLQNVRVNKDFRPVDFVANRVNAFGNMDMQFYLIFSFTRTFPKMHRLITVKTQGVFILVLLFWKYVQCFTHRLGIKAYFLEVTSHWRTFYKICCLI